MTTTSWKPLRSEALRKQDVQKRAVSWLSAVALNRSETNQEQECYIPARRSRVEQCHLSWGGLPGFSTTCLQSSALQEATKTMARNISLLLYTCKFPSDWLFQMEAFRVALYTCWKRKYTIHYLNHWQE